MILNTEVECISINGSASTTQKNSSNGGKKNRHSDRDHGRDSESDSGSGSDSRSGSDSDSGSDSGSGSDSDGDKTYTVKLTPEIIGYIRNYIRKNQFLDEFDLITEIELDKYEHSPGSALVFNSDSIVFMTNNQTLEAVGEWEYIESEKPVVSGGKSSKSKNGKGRDRHRDRDRDDDSDDHSDNEREGGRSQYKTKDDDLPVGEIESILTEKFQEYNKTREFVIHESKNSFLVLLIKGVELVKA